jgi:hypothetical protein
VRSNTYNLGSKNNNNKIQNNYLTWLAIYLVIGFAISFLFPLPISLAILLLVFFLLNIVRTEIALRKSGMGGIKGVYKSMSSFGNAGVFGFGGLSYTPIKFYCMKCGFEHRKTACPKCGSKMVRV